MFEIERKFLVRKCFKPRGPSSQISQSYWQVGPLSLRVRKIEDTYLFTIKSRNNGERRMELEFRIPEWFYRAAKKRGGRTLLKRRVFHAENGRIWEIDQYLNSELQGLRVAEIEFKKGETIGLPSWVTDEVTDDPRYRNENLVSRLK